ncbi:MAG TPA: DUF368 domain-containing protein, partial [Bacillaceae bacterium]
FIMRTAQVKRNFTAKHIVMLVLALILVASMAFLDSGRSADPIASLTFASAIGLFLAGWLASMAMLLPGISGSFILLLIGVYPTAIEALSELNLPIIAVIGAGVILGFIISSKAIKYLLSHFPHMTYAAILGLIIGSLFVVFPGIEVVSGQWLISMLTFIIGFLVAFLFGSKDEEA